MFPLSGRGGGGGGRHFRAFAAGNGTYLWKLLDGGASIYTHIEGRTGGFLGNAESAESAGIFAILGGILRELRHFSKANVTSVFTMFPLRGGGFPGRHFRTFPAGIGTYLRRLLEGVCPSIPTSTVNPVDFWGMQKCRKCMDFRHFPGNPYGVLALS